MSKRDDIALTLQTKLDALFAFPVYIQRYLPSSVLPAAIIYTTGDTPEKSADESTNLRTENVFIIIQDTGHEEHEASSGEQTIEEKLNAYALQVEGVLNKVRYNLDNVVFRFNFTGTEKSYKTDADQLIGIIKLNYSAIWHERMTL